MKPIIIIGAGLAGYSVAREFRKLDKLTPLMIMTADDGDFYSKPMLSNAFAQNKLAEQLISQNATQMAAQLNASIMTGNRVQAIDTANKSVATDFGIFEYDKLVMAVGAQPIRVPLDGDAADQVLSINHISDYIAFRTRVTSLQHKGPVHIAILGAGLVGCEFANDLIAAGHAVTLIDPNQLPLAALAAPALSQGLQAALLAQGIALRLGTTAARIDRSVDAVQVTLADGTTFDADIVLSAVGLRADLSLEQAAQLSTGRGIQVDATGCTSAPNVYALGDCTEYTMPGDGGMRTLPYIAPLLNAARAIARTLTGVPTAIDLNAAPVIVKTPCFPLALIAPPIHAHATGYWQSESANENIICRFFDENNVMLGFGAAPHEAGLRKKLLAELNTLTSSKAVLVAI